MHRRLALILSASFIFYLCVAFSPFTRFARAAQTISTSSLYVQDAHSTVNDDLYITANNVRIDGTVNGDVIVAAVTVTVNGRINGSLIAAAGAVIVNGRVDNSVREFGASFVNNGFVGHDLNFAGSTLSIGSKGYVGRGILAVASNVNISGRVSRSVRLADTTTSVGSRAYIGGGLSYTSSTAAVIAPGAHIVGESSRTVPASTRSTSSSVSFLAIARSTIGWILFGLLLLTIGPGFMQQAVGTVRNRFARISGWGALFLFGGPIVIILAFILGLLIGGWWIALIAAVAYVMAFFVGSTIISLAIGELLLARTRYGQSLVLSLIIGVLVVEALTNLPSFLGIVAVCVIAWLGAGALTMTCYQLIRRSRVTAIV